VAIGDVKYKEKTKEADRYQVIAHALSVKCNKAVLVYPATQGVEKGLVRIGSIGPNSSEIELFEYGFDLNGEPRTPRKSS